MSVHGTSAEVVQVRGTYQRASFSAQRRQALDRRARGTVTARRLFCGGVLLGSHRQRCTASRTAAGSRPRTSQIATNAKGQWVSSLSTQASASCANRRPRRPIERKRPCTHKSASSSTARISAASGHRPPTLARGPKNCSGRIWSSTQCMRCGFPPVVTARTSDVGTPPGVRAREIADGMVNIVSFFRRALNHDCAVLRFARERPTQALRRGLTVPPP